MLDAFDYLGDECLRLLWETGALPCVLDIVQAEKAVV
jgi:hypothetical protein